MRFRDRLDAADRLARPLGGWRGRQPLVLAVPRGAVGMARRLAQTLQGEFDLVLVRKLRAPGSPEVAVGAVAEDGWTWIAPWAGSYGADAEYLAQEVQAQREVLRTRRAHYQRLRAALPLAGRTVIVVDDGTATGATLLAALHAVRAQKPARLICAVPVASQEALARLKPHCDELVCLQADADFGAVGAYYAEFDQVEDSEVEAMLTAAASAPAPATEPPAADVAAGTAFSPAPARCHPAGGRPSRVPPRSGAR